VQRTLGAPFSEVSMEPQTPKGWWGRNWKWFVPVGCLGSLVLFAAFIAGILFLVFGIMKSSDVYEEALALAEADPAVVEALGDPIDDGLFVSGNINLSGPSGDANLAIPLSGPRASGTLYAKAVRNEGEWEFTELVLVLDDPSGERIDLLKKGLRL
jgi:hypothetical protein